MTATAIRSTSDNRARAHRIDEHLTRFATSGCRHDDQLLLRERGRANHLPAVTERTRIDDVDRHDRCRACWASDGGA